MAGIESIRKGMTQPRRAPLRMLSILQSRSFSDNFGRIYSFPPRVVRGAAATFLTHKAF